MKNNIGDIYERYDNETKNMAYNNCSNAYIYGSNW
jgi:hypothetical protein